MVSKLISLSRSIYKGVLGEDVQLEVQKKKF